jgi:hypothetical protein
VKKTVKYLLSLFLLLCIEVAAQDKAGTHSEIPSKTSMKGRRELRKDKRVKRHEEKALKANKEKLETQSDKSFIKKKHRKTPKNKKEDEEIIKKE